MERLSGIRGVKVPVTDLARSLEWYRAVFDVQPMLEFPDADGVVRGIACTVPGIDEGIALRENPEVARGIAGFDPFIWAVEDRAHIERWATHLDEAGVPHSPVIDATLGWLLVFHDPDGLEHHLYTKERHHIDHETDGTYGRTATPG